MKDREAAQAEQKKMMEAEQIRLREKREDERKANARLQAEENAARAAKA